MRSLTCDINHRPPTPLVRPSASEQSHQRVRAKTDHFVIIVIIIISSPARSSLRHGAIVHLVLLQCLSHARFLTGIQ